MKRVGFSKALQAALYFLIPFTPLAFGSVHPWAYRVIEFFAFGLLSLWFLRACLRGGFSYVKTPMLYFLPLSLSFFLLQVIPLPAGIVDAVSPGRAALRDAAGIGPASGTLALYPWAARDQAVYLSSILVIFLLVINHVKTRRQVTRIIYTALGTGALLAVLAFVQNAALDRASFLPFVNKNHFAGYMEALAPMAAAMLLFKVAGEDKGAGLKGALLCTFSGPGSVSAVVLAFLSVLFSTAVVFTGSRGGILALLSSFVVLGALAARNRRQAALLLGICALLFFVSLGMASDSYVIRRIGSLKDLVHDSSALFRCRIWEDTAKVVRDFPAAGVGLGGFETAYPFYKGIEGEYNVFQPENDYLYILTEGGVIGLALAAAFYAVYICRTVSWSHRRKDGFVLGVSAGALSGLAALLLHGFAETNLHMPAILLLMTLMMALGYVCMNCRSGRHATAEGHILLARKKVRAKGAAARTALAAGGLFFAFLALTALAGSIGNLLYRSALTQEAAIAAGGPWSPRDHEGPIAKLRLASRLDPGCAMHGFEEGRACLLMAEYSAAMEAMGAVPAGTPSSGEYYLRALGCFRGSLECNPYSSFGHLMAGRALVRGLGDVAGGEREYLAAARLNPTSRFIRLYLAANYKKRRTVP